MENINLITKKDLCSKLKISVGSLDKLVSTGKIKSIKLGRLVRFNEKDLFNTKNAEIPAIVNK